MPKNKDDKPSNTVSNLLKAKKNREENTAIIEEKANEYKEALNGICNSEYGKLVFKTLIAASGVFEPVATGDAKALLRANDRNVYLNFIRPYLEPELRKELEN